MSDSNRAVFLSYASQDASAAGTLTQALRAAGIEVWFDQSELRGGEVWDTSIRRQIRACSLFIPLISKNTHAREEGYFRLEWKLAVDRSHLMASSRTFLLPVVIDDTRDDDDRVPDRFRDVQWTRLPDGRATGAFIDRIANLLSSDRVPDERAAANYHPSATRAAATPRGVANRGLWLAAVVLIAAAAFGIYRLSATRIVTAAQPTSPPTSPAAPATNPIPDKSIAVLPFVDMSEKKDQEYFSDGLAEELLDMLAQVRDLRVAARTSSFSFKGKSDDIAVIAQKLRVAHVLEGSVRRSGDVIRVSAQLIRADNGYDLWSKTYDRQVKDIFKVQDEIAAAVVDALKLQLLPSQQIESRHRTASTDAYTQYLLGNQNRMLDTADSNSKALVAYQSAIALDPNYAAAYAAFAETQWRLVDSVSGDVAALARASAAADKAIELAPDLPEGYWARGTLRNFRDWDWSGAKADYEKALALDPNFSPAYMALGNLLATLGQIPEAIVALQKALSLDPLSVLNWRRLGLLQVVSGQIDQALVCARRIHEINPAAEDRLVGFARLYSNQYQEALAAFEASASINRLQGIAMAEYSLGHQEASDRALEEFIRQRGRQFAYQFTQVYAWRGENDKAFEWLNVAYQIHDGGLSYLLYDPDLKKIRNDPRFDSLLRKVHLAPLPR
jgi:TolB-like protein